MGREFERKYAVSEDVFADIAQEFVPFSVIQMETAYFDTADSSLSQRKITLRRRLENLCLDTLTPIEAMNELFSLKKML